MKGLEESEWRVTLRFFMLVGVLAWYAVVYWVRGMTLLFGGKDRG